MNPEDPLAEQILGIQLIPSLPKLGVYHRKAWQLTITFY